MDEISILKRKIGSISQLDVVNHPATESGGYPKVKVNAKIYATNTHSHDHSIIEDSFNDNERQIFGLTCYSAFQMLSLSASKNVFLRNIKFGNEDRKRRFSIIVAPDKSWVADKDHSGRIMTQLSDLSAVQDRVTLTKQTSKAFAQQIAGNPVSKRRPFSANDTLKSLADVASSSSFMPKTEKGKAQLVISNPLIYDTSFSKNLHDVTFVGDNEISDADILSGRGGKSNHHVGIKRFRHLVSEMKSMYRSAAQKTARNA